MVDVDAAGLEDVELIDGETGLIALARNLVNTDAVYRLSTEKRRHLILLADERRQHPTQSLLRNPTQITEIIHLLLEIIRSRRSTESHPGDILLAGLLESFRQLCRLAYTDQEHPGSKRVQGAGVPDL